jgi:hypothetical protein
LTTAAATGALQPRREPTARWTAVPRGPPAETASSHRAARAARAAELRTECRVAAAQAVAGCELVGEFTEVESGKHAARPELAKALAQCKRERAKLIIAKLDRLSRNVVFLAALMERGVTDAEDASQVCVGR